MTSLGQGCIVSTVTTPMVLWILLGFVYHNHALSFPPHNRSIGENLLFWTNLPVILEAFLQIPS